MTTPVQQEADKLRAEASEILYRLLNTPPGRGREVNRFVECIIGSAMLEIAAMQSLVPPSANAPSE